MAKPIGSTPILRGQSAIDFINEMAKTEKRPMNKKEKALFKAAGF